MNFTICDHCGTSLCQQKDGSWKSEAQLENEKLKEQVKQLKRQVQNWVNHNSAIQAYGPMVDD